MTKAYKCDRCHKFFEKDDDYRWKDKFMFKQMFDGKVYAIDLCSDCHEKFCDWIWGYEEEVKNE